MPGTSALRSTSMCAEKRQLDLVVEDLDEDRALAAEGPGDRDEPSARAPEKRTKKRSPAPRGRPPRPRDTPLCGRGAGVDEGDRDGAHRGEGALERRQHQRADGVLGHPTLGPNRDLIWEPMCQGDEHAAQTLGQGKEGAHLLATSGPRSTLTALSTSSPLRAAATERATSTPALSCASTVEAPRWGVRTTWGSRTAGFS